MEDIIIDVIADGRVLHPKDIPLAISAEIEAMLANGEAPQALEYEGVYYVWSVRPCVYP